MAITQTVSAWIHEYSSVGPDQIASGDTRVPAKLAYSDADIDMTSSGWTYCGKATITLEPVGSNTLISNKIDALREQAKTIKAEAQAKVTKIEEQINNLLAITYEPSEGHS